MSTSPRVFSLEEANAMVPRLQQLVGAQLQLAQHIQRLTEELFNHPERRRRPRFRAGELRDELKRAASLDLRDLSGGAASVLSADSDAALDDAQVELLDITPADDDDIEVRALKRKLRLEIGRYHQGWEQVQGLGVVVKDPASGLLDFYGRVDDRLVCLCWRYGEDAVDHYHELGAGFSGRKPLADVRKRLLN